MNYHDCVTLQLPYMRNMKPWRIDLSELIPYVVYSVSVHMLQRYNDTLLAHQALCPRSKHAVCLVM
jgi:hypothetical protein